MNNARNRSEDIPKVEATGFPIVETHVGCDCGGRDLPFHGLGFHPFVKSSKVCSEFLEFLLRKRTRMPTRLLLGRFGSVFSRSRRIIGGLIVPHHRGCGLPGM